MQRSPPVRRRDSGACQDTRRFNKPCQTATSTRLVSPGSMSLFKLNPVEPPWYVSRMPGGGGGVAPRGVPLSRSITLTRHRLSNNINDLEDYAQVVTATEGLRHNI